jgi:hypothetical protein
MKISTDFLVIGGGLAGCGIALELAKHGKNSVLIEQDPVPMNRASLRNEGKIHLGLIYAADPSKQTGFLQLKGSLQFHLILESWLGKGFSRIEQSTPFFYLVANDSLQTPDQLADHYQALNQEYCKLLEENPKLNYLGSQPSWLTKRVELEALDGTFNTSRFSAAFSTNEKAINTDDLAREIRNAVQNTPNIELITNCKVDDISDYGSYYKVKAKSNLDSSSLEIDAKTVFNAAWDQRLLIDKLAGVDLPNGWLHRLKYRVIASTLPEHKDLPSATIVLGAYGDVVVRKDSAYLSWYPSGMQGWTHDIRPPETWNRVCSGNSIDKESQAVGTDIFSKTIEWYPKLNASKIATIDAGAIFAYGESDVNDISSKLHNRNNTGVFRKGNYLSIDTGKLTTAPMYAVDAVNQVLRVRSHE